MNERRVYEIKDGVMTLLPSDPIEIIEHVCTERVGCLRFTPHNEMREYEEKISQSKHAKKFCLYEYRLDAGLSVRCISEILGISKATYHNIESGTSYPQLPLALKMAKLFGTSVEELFVVK